MTSKQQSNKHRVLLMILDGWGYNKDKHTLSNALLEANIPTLNQVEKEYYCTLLDAHGRAVGLPEGEMGNSEVGHLTIGAGRIIKQYRTRIDEAIHQDKFQSAEALRKALENCKKKSNRIHFIGLLSDGGVHSHQLHLYELLKAAKKAHIPHVYVHAILDGRDTPPHSASKYINELLAFLDKEDVGALADVIGRHYAMDRDKVWDRIANAMKLYLRDEGVTDEHVATEQLEDILQGHYQDGLNDQQIPAYPTHSEGNIKEGDTVVLFNFRNDRMKQLTEALTGAHKFNHEDLELPKDIHVVSMVPYDEKFDIPTIFNQEDVPMTLPEAIAKESLSQFHCAETEKYAHVTYFFAGMKEQQFPLEKRKMVPSPNVDTYDKAPAMSTKEVAQEVIKALQSNDYSFILSNLAPLDMVGHTGKFEATVRACEAVDNVIHEIIDAVKEVNSKEKTNPWVVCIAGDHGNCEQMEDKGEPMTSHTKNPVRFIVIGDEFKAKHSSGTLKVTGGLQDIAPTVLSLLGIQKPREMTGHCLDGLSK